MSNDASSKGAGLLGLGAGASKTSGGLLSGSGFAAMLANQGLNGRQKVEGLYYLNKKIVLDGYSFISCRFDNCILSVSTTNFDLSGCIVDDSCRVEYGVELIKIIQLFNSRNPKSYEFFEPPFVPIRNQDGTITIKSRP